MILSQNVLLKVGNWCPKSVKSQKGWCNKPTKLQFNQFNTKNPWCSRNATVTNQPKSIVELGYMCPQGLAGPPAVMLNKQLKYKKRLLLRCIYIYQFLSDLIDNTEHMRIMGTCICTLYKSKFLLPSFSFCLGAYNKIYYDTNAWIFRTVKIQITLQINCCFIDVLVKIINPWRTFFKKLALL